MASTVERTAVSSVLRAMDAEFSGSAPAAAFTHCGGDVIDDAGKVIDLADALELAAIFADAAERATNRAVAQHMSRTARAAASAAAEALRWRRCARAA